MKDFKRFNINLVSGDAITNGKGKFITLVESDGSIEQVNEGGIYTDWELSEFCYRLMPIPELVSENCEVEFFTEINDGKEVTLWRPDIKWMREFIEMSDKAKQIEPHIIGDILPKEGEWWMGHDEEGDTTVAVLIYGEWWSWLSGNDLFYPFTPAMKMMPVSSIESVECKTCAEHVATINNLTDGFSLISEACKSRGLGDRPYTDIIKLLSDAEDKLTNLENKPKEVVSLQIDGLPPLDSVVYLVPSKETGNGNPSFTAKNPGRKVKIYSHFVDDRNISLASYVSCDDKPVIGGVAIASAFETEDEKQDREIDSICEDVLVSAPGMDKAIARRIAAGLHGKDYYKGEK